jgi:phage repressor protein C with HTH and peptisase S24 domain
MSFGMAVVAGLSMVPTLAPGERLLVRYDGPIVLGDLVVFKYAGQIDVKRIERIETSGLFVLGDNDLVSTDSRNYGLIAHEDVLGTIVMRIWPKPGRIISG